MKKWTRHGAGLRCDKHDQVFGRLGQCPQCVGDPVERPGAEGERALPPAPTGCRTSVEHEVWLTAIADFALEQARKLCSGKGRINYSTGAKFLECAIKANRAAAVEFTATRERRAYIKELRAERARLRRGAKR